MNHAMINAASGVRAMQLRVDTIANNLANSDTVGFKSSDTTFASMLTRKLDNQPYPQYEQGRQTPYGTRPGFGAKEALQVVNYTQGSMKQTDSPTDLFLQGEEALFRVQRAGVNGRPNETYFTRAGNFSLMPTNNGQLALLTAQGDAVMDNAGQPVRIPSGATNFTVNADGQIVYKLNDVQTQGPRIGVYTVQNLNILHPAGENYYRVPVEQIGGNAQWTDYVRLSNANGAAMPNGVGIQQRALEASNVDLRKEMTMLIEAQRGLQFNARAISFNDQMSDITNRIYKG
ncbi:flagellar basal-body rod protein FlgG [Aneurinibacillus soli]|uniref:Flagellar basal-body rod protein FlgG n=1 Tax=Aneurinibacillus soli TaxID=1500254 RepID=A0A0U5B6N3_9BACL|nr:flagellar hook-basal body protein [Aneurinibacillus soli]PYE61552.1 flagellar basal-body rod protein FlgG [Aneurinibacillus soli]BAU26493.1 Flagellar basal-body rod protein FlgG [Aneurinibacillus soli]